MKQYRLINNITGWIVFIIASMVYILTIEPTASFWDCGEFITAAYRLEVGHPPGAPFFMLMARFFTLFAANPQHVATMINILSATASGFTILFLFWSITHMAKKLVIKNEEYTPGKIAAVIGSGLVGALAFTFSDSFWFSAVEAIVFASSSLFTALVFWAILKWEEEADDKHATRWIILIAFLVGLSIGVHLLNLLAIPAMVFVFYFRKFKVSKKGIFYTSIIAVIILAAVMYGIIHGVIIAASWFELLFVNGFGLPYNSGVLFYIVILLGLIIWSLYYTYKRGKVILNTTLLAVTAILIGYSSYAIVVIRSVSKPPMAQNNPDNVFHLLYYLSREQYGDRPLLYGQYYNAVYDAENPVSKGSPKYIKKDGIYVISNYKQTYNYDSRFCTFFPRMYSDQEDHITEYKKWANIVGRPVKATNRNGEEETIYCPTFGENLKFFFKYQIGFMYLRYFMWNFAGRQNDLQGSGECTKGNWISGIRFIDQARLGPQDNLPDFITKNKGHNVYYMLPLLLGIIGLVYHYLRDKRNFTVIVLLFFFTGIAIVLYLNQYPLQPRERDYSYVGSFYAFAIWIGLGVLAIYEFLKKHIPELISAVAVTLICLLLVPRIMAKENWNDHDRSGRFTCRDFAYDYLNSCAPNSVLFTNGDNDTFPLWYAQEVEGIRTDIRVCNLSYLATDWYIDQMKRKAYDSDPVPFGMTSDQYVEGKRDYVPLYDKSKGYLNLKSAMKFVTSDNPKALRQVSEDDAINYIPSKNFCIPVDSAEIIRKGVLSKKDEKLIVDSIKWRIGKNYIMKNDLMILDLLANNDWNRPVYFAITVGSSNYLKLEDYFQIEGLAYRLVPIKTKSQAGHIGRMETEKMYDNMMHKFRWGGIDNPHVYLDENIQRMLMNFKSNLARLATQLYIENKKDKSKEVCDRCQQLMPNNLIPYNYFNAQIAEVYYNLSESNKANDIVKILADNANKELLYYFSLDKERISWIQEDMERQLALMNELVKMIKRHNQPELQKDLEAKFNNLYKMYTTKGL
ncbi:MAG: DUF2723 domain-containing protein [Bacteroidia bacterium]|nr:DUF2723 domain-containing protein [Bacteroidia bacterium]